MALVRAPREGLWTLRRAVVAAAFASLLAVLNGCAYTDEAATTPLLTWSIAPVPESEPEAAVESEGISRSPHHPRFEATAYCTCGLTASGKLTKRGLVAADPEVLPMGARIAVHNAGEYSGLYTVADTGSKIKGRKIDIFIDNEEEARAFGRRQVEVQVLNRPAAQTVAQETMPLAGGAVR